MTIDYTKPIRAHADWDETLSWPARVVGGPNGIGNYRVAIDERHLLENNDVWHDAGAGWFFNSSGESICFSITIRNVEEKPKELAAWGKVPRAALDQTAKEFGYKDWQDAQIKSPTSLIWEGMKKSAQRLATYEKPEPDRALEAARQHFADGYDEGSTPAAIMRGEWDGRNCITGFVAGYNRGLKDAQG